MLRFRRIIWRDLALMFLLSFAVRLALAILIVRPGYMDVAYYAAGAVHLSRRGAFDEPFIWNYLNDPLGAPHPGFLYWMPLPSLLAAPFAALFPGSFLALQLPFAVLSSMLPCVAYAIAWRTTERRGAAWGAGLLTLFSGFFFPFWTLPETFAPFALLGSLSIWLAARNIERGASNWKPLLIGVLIGLAHLTRADGLILLPLVALAPLLAHNVRRETCSKRLVLHFALVILGYLLVMTPWFVRNLLLIGAPLSSASAKTLWLTNYDDLYCYECDLSPRAYLAWGWGNILRSKLWAMRVNLERFLAEDCLVFLLPFVLIGLYRLRRRLAFMLAGIYLLLIFVAHSLAFTFPGPRGGFFHAGAAALPFLFVAGMEGLEAAVGWAARRRRWNRRQAQAVFGAAAVVGAAALSVYAAGQKLPGWRSADAVYLKVGAWLDERSVPDSAVVMVGNPPAFWYHNHRPAVVVPNDDVETLLEVVDRYGVSYVLLDRNRPAALKGASHPRLYLVEEWGGGKVVLYRVE